MAPARVRIGRMEKEGEEKGLAAAEKRSRTRAAASHVVTSIAILGEELMVIDVGVD